MYDFEDYCMTESMIMANRPQWVRGIDPKMIVETKNHTRWLRNHKIYPVVRESFWALGSIYELYPGGTVVEIEDFNPMARIYPVSKKRTC